MPDKKEIAGVLERTTTYLTKTLLPFWLERSVDQEMGGFLSYFDRNGKPTGETTKTFLMQIRGLYTMSSTHRYGYGDGKTGELAKMSANFIKDHYWDDKNEGWNWIADRGGKVTYAGKVGYGQCFGIYAFSEYFLATGDPMGQEMAQRTYAAVAKNMVDTRYGGFYELMQPDWQPERPGKYGGDRKSMDVHMHMMEALTSFYQMTGHATHRRRLLEVIDLIIDRMLDPKFGLGYIQFTQDFEPLPAILFAVEWGRDAERKEDQARPLNHTSYGHNVEFAWLLLHAADILGLPRTHYGEVVKRIVDHCVEYGIDWEYGGVLVEGPMDSPTPITEKQFWQQAEVLVGLLDAYALFGDEKYWKAFMNVYNFVFDKFVNMAGGGEWYERVDRLGNPIDAALGHAWKINYHTVRSMVQTIERLKKLVG